MTLEERKQANDALRTLGQGGRLLMTPAVRDLDPHLRGRLLHRLALYSRFDDESDHSEGVFIFCGYGFYFDIRMVDGIRTLTLYLEKDLLAATGDLESA